MRDEELIKRIRQGDKYLFGDLADRYYDEIFRFCYYKTGNEQTAYDCTQETFFHLLRFMDSYVEVKKFKGYLLRIALNVCRDYYRKHPLENSLDAMEENGVEAADGTGLQGIHTGYGDGSQQERIENGIVIQQCLMQLPDHQRETIILRFYHGYKVREIAEITGVGLAAAKSRLKQGMEKLKRLLEKEGIYGNE